jgi:ferredoxin-nitrite reductase
MSIDLQNYRIEGVYRQRQDGFFMQRIKLPGGVISAEQALQVADLAERHARGVVHLTSRGSMELHWLTPETLSLVARQLARVGLDGRGACGGAVRGVVCSSLAAAANPQLEALVRRIHRHFSGNPHFEQLPKKFKIAVEADTASGRHLIQDLALVPAASDAAAWDVWVAGGLGREPQPGFRLAEAVTEAQLIPLIEVVIRLYIARTPAGKRLKHLVREIGQESFRELVSADPAAAASLPAVPALAAALLPEPAGPAGRLEARIFAGELAAEALATLASLAAKWADGMLLVTGEQDIVLHLAAAADPAAAQQALAATGFAGTARGEQVAFRVCPGSHECRMGLAPTRDLAGELVALFGPGGMKMGWAISGCPNSCTQPQLADIGIVAARLVNEEGERTPRFDLYRRVATAPFAAVVGQGLSREELLQAVAAIG